MSDTLKEQLEALLKGEEFAPEADSAPETDSAPDAEAPGPEADVAVPDDAAGEGAEAPVVEDSPFAVIADLLKPEASATEEATGEEATDETSTDEATAPEGKTPQAGPEASEQTTEESTDVPVPEATPSEAAAEVAVAGAGSDEEQEQQEGQVAVKTLSPYDLPGSWYVVHSYSGYENKVRANLESRIKSMHMENQIFDVMIPMEDVVEFKGGRKVTVPKKVFPGYILVRLYMDEDAWFVVRNTPGVTGFVGSGTKPTPLSRREVERILGVDKPDEEKKAPRFKPDWEVGETVRVVEGPFADFNGMIEDINVDQSKVRVLVDIFGRETPVELSFEQIQKY